MLLIRAWPNAKTEALQAGDHAVDGQPVSEGVTAIRTQAAQHHGRLWP